MNIPTQELADACEVIAWLARQSWCSGAVGMMGKSWGGFNCLQTAFLQPEALKAVISVCSTTDRFADDIHFNGGCLLGENFGWGTVMLSLFQPAARPGAAGGLARGMAETAGGRALAGAALGRPPGAGRYWKHGSVCEDYSRMKIPVMSFGGWADNYMNTCAALVKNCHGPVQAIVGPWGHQYAHTATPGPQIGFLQLAIRWWDRWLKGNLNGAEADGAYRAYMLHSEPPNASARQRAGHWLREEVWPSPRVRQEILFLAAHPGALPPSGGFVGPAAKGGYLRQDESSEGIEATIATPQHLGMQAGEFFPMGLNAEMPGDQAGDDALSVCFDGPELEAPLELLGAAQVTLRLASDKPLGFVVARLCDVAPDGASVRIAHGMLNLCHRTSRESPERMVPGEVFDCSLDLDQMAYRVAPGHRLRLALSNSYWPFVWPSPEAGRLTLTSGRLDLPVCEGASMGWEPPLAEHAPVRSQRVAREASAGRRIEQDLVTGRYVLVVQEDSGEKENLVHGLVSGGSLSERWEIDPDDPLSARAETVREQRLSRGAWQVRTRAWTEMTGTREALKMRARLQAWEGGALVFDRSWDEDVTRRFV